MSKRSSIKRSTSHRENNGHESSSSSDYEGAMTSVTDEKKSLSPSLSLLSSKQAQSKQQWHWIFPVILFVSLGIFLLCNFWWPRCSNEGNREKAISIKKIIKDIESKFPSQHKDLWSSLFSALKTVSECDSLCPKVVLLLNQEDELSKATSNCLVTMVGNYSAPIFEAGQPLILKGDDFNCKNDCYDELRNKVLKHGTVIIQHLEKFPKESAAVLHFFCDEHDSSSAKAAYILTMTINNDEKEPTKAAEKAIYALWPEMKEEVRMALIARLTSLVGHVNPEQSLPCDV